MDVDASGRRGAHQWFGVAGGASPALRCSPRVGCPSIVRERTRALGAYLERSSGLYGFAINFLRFGRVPGREGFFCLALLDGRFRSSTAPTRVLRAS